MQRFRAPALPRTFAPRRAAALPRAFAMCLGAALLLALGAAPAGACPGGAPGCPYTTASEIGQRSGGVLRFPQAVAVARDGTVFVGDQGSGVVHVFGPDGRFRQEIGRPGSRSGELTAGGALAVAGDGSLVVGDGSNRIKRFTPDGRLLNQWGRTGTGVGQFRFGGGRGNDAGAGGGLAAGGRAVYVADSGNNRIQRFDLDGSKGTVIVPPGMLAYPKGLATRGTRLLVADNQNHRVLAMDTGGRLLRTIRTDASVGRGQFSHPYGVTIGPSGRVFVADNMNHRVVRFSTAPNYPYKGRWGAYGTGPGRLAYPRAISSDARGNVYVTNTGNDRIEVFDRGGGFLRSFGSSGRAPGQFNTPMGLAVDAAGYRAVADSVNGRIVLLAPDGAVAAVWGSPNPGPTILQRPVAVAFDAGGNAFVLDQRRARIFVFDRASGTPRRSIAAQGRGPGRLLDPSALAIDGNGVIHVADTGNQRVARFAADGTYLGAITGTGRIHGIAVTPDGTRTYVSGTRNRITVYGPGGEELNWFGGTGNKLGKLSVPAQLTLDAAGDLWVADRGNHRVQRFGPEGQRLGMFGRRGTGSGEFLRPTGVAVDCRGVVSVTDVDNNRVHQFTLASPPAATCAELPPLAQPPPPKYPTLPPPDGPDVSLRALRTKSLLSTRNLPVRLGCDTACSVEAAVTLSPRAAPPRGRRAVRVTLRARARIPAGESRLLRFRLSARQASELRRGLRGLRGMNADVRLTARAAAGEPTELSQRLPVTG
jgi:tripartite motif-containing protein 71